MAGQSFFELSKLIDSLPPMADGENSRDAFSVTFRDDRVMDQGLDKIEVVDKNTIDVAPFKVEPGTPQTTVTVRPTTSGTGGRLVFKATDVAGNSSFFTICYVFDTRSERYVYQINQGRGVECVSEDGWMIGAYGMLSHTRMDADFTTTGNLNLQGPTIGQAEGFAGGLGLLVGRRLAPNIIVNGRLSLSGQGGTLLTPDTTVGTAFDTASGKQVLFQEGTETSISAPYLRIGGTFQWFPLRFFYLTGGAQLAMAMGSSVDVQRTILRPSHATYPNGERSVPEGTTSLESLSFMGVELLGGLGFSYPVSYRGSVFLESTYTWRATGLLFDASLRGDAIGLNLGFIWRL